MSRSSSATSTLLQYQQPTADLNLTRPALSTLASIASDHTSHLRAYNNGGHIMMTYATSSPAATSGGGHGNNNIPPVCQNCATSTTPLWRRDEVGSVLCNACGLFLKLHGTPRPISLKTDVIKSRHRVKTASQALKKRSLFEGSEISTTATRAEAGTPPSNHSSNRRTSQKTSSGGSERSFSPVSRSDTPTIRHPSNIAPQHIFDGVSLPEHTFQPSPSMPSLNLRHPSPGSNSSTMDRHLEPPQSYDGLLQSTTALKTRVSELEVINDLFRGRVAQLEQLDSNARRTEMMQRDSENKLRQLLDQSQARENDLKRRIDELEREVAELRGSEPRAKRQRVSEPSEYSNLPRLSDPPEYPHLPPVSDSSEYSTLPRVSDTTEYSTLPRVSGGSDYSSMPVISTT